MSEARTAPPPRKKRSARHGQGARKAGACRGRVPVRTLIILTLLLMISALALGIARGNKTRLANEREKQAEEYERLVARHTVAYRAWIERYAAENDLQPAYVAAIILRESSYDPGATSGVGARGLMQVMEDTFAFCRRNLGEDGATFDDMYDPETNIRYGCWYLGYLSRIFNGDPVEIACAYHAGANNVKLWIMNYASDGERLRVEEIPMEDTRYYAGKVVDAYAIYFQHYYQT